MKLILTAEELQHRNKAKKNLLWIGIISIIMFFGGFTSAYIIRQEKGEWISLNIPMAFWISTIIIIVSSFTMQWAIISIKKSQLKNVKLAVLITFLLGVSFACSQYMGWHNLLAKGTYLVGPGSNASGQFFYVITVAHLCHLFGGLIALLIALFKSLMGKYSSSNYTGLTLCATYWHFLDVLWIYLFLFLYFIR